MSDNACRLLLLLLRQKGEGTRKAKDDGRTTRRRRRKEEPSDRVETWCLEAGILVGGLCHVEGEGREGVSGAFGQRRSASCVRGTARPRRYNYTEADNNKRLALALTQLLHTTSHSTQPSEPPTSSCAWLFVRRARIYALTPRPPTSLHRHTGGPKWPAA